MPDEQRRTAAAAADPVSPAVLVIDDDPAMVESLAVVLEDYGFRVLTAPGGVRGLEVFREHGPAAVLTDIIMPEQDGIGTILQIRRERPETKIIAISGGGRIGKSDLLTIAGQLGADGTFEKGRHPKVLVEMLNRMLGR